MRAVKPDSRKSSECVPDPGAGKDGERALAESELRYRRLFETAKDGILILNAATGQIVDANPYLQTMLGYLHSELLGKTLWEIGPFKDVCASRDAFRRLQEREYVRYDNLPLETKEHERRQVEFISNVYLVDGRKVIQCNIRDITERVLAEDRARKINEDLVSLVNELQRRDRETKLHSDMNELLQSCTTQQEAFTMLELKAGDVFVGQTGCLAVMKAGESLLEPVAQWGPLKSFVSCFGLSDCWALRRGQVHEVVDPSQAIVCRHFAEPPAGSYVCVPLTVQGDTLGVLSVVCAASARVGIASGQANLALAVGETIKLVLSNLRLRESLGEQANRDSLTGLYNRRYLDDSLSREINLSQRRNEPLSIAVLDVDHFKDFNDTFGHDAGDMAMRALAEVLRQNLRSTDIACRFGGDEFALLLPNSSLSDTFQRVQDLCTLTRRLRMQHEGRSLGAMTLSAGIAVSPDHAATAGGLLRAGDAALYTAKETGRDRVVLYEPTVR